MLSTYERDDFCSTFTVFDFGQFLTFPEMSLTFILLPPEVRKLMYGRTTFFLYGTKAVQDLDCTA